MPLALPSSEALLMVLLCKTYESVAFMRICIWGSEHEWAGVPVFIWPLSERACPFLPWCLTVALLNSCLIIMECQLECLIRPNEMGWVHYYVQSSSFQWHLVFSFMRLETPRCELLLFTFSAGTGSWQLPQNKHGTIIMRFHTGNKPPWIDNIIMVRFIIAQCCCCFVNILFRDFHTAFSVS